MIDIILTRTQRKTPTVIHPGYKITRIRSFYMRKVKFTQQSVDEKFGAILTEFPRLDDIHPFYSDLMNILYDRDHYKLALGQVNTAKSLIGGISKDYLRLLKYGDSLYRCKTLKRAALGRMCTVMKKLKAALGYLEEVRKHISRLPALDPSTRTLLLTGYPNVGKSSFMNKITRADVEVQPYAFTTKALFVGHMDHRFLRWQVVDTPGILDRPLEERNTIEMQAITALAHLQCCILYFLDISEQCGYTLDQQLKLFESIRPLFVNKQVILVANKIDVLPYESLPAHARRAIEDAAKAANAELIPMSNISEENISKLKITACDKLLEARVDSKLSSGRVKDDVLSRITVAMPKPRDNLAREPYIPDSVTSGATKGALGGERATEKDLMWKQGGPGVYSCDYRKYYLLEEDEWRFDPIPTMMDGKNVLDFFDPDIEEKLRQLEEEEAQLEASGAYDTTGGDDMDDDDEIDQEERLLHEAIKSKQIIARKQSHETKSRLPMKLKVRTKTGAEIQAQLESVGLESAGVVESTRGRKRTRSVAPVVAEGDAMLVDEPRVASVTRSGSRGPSVVREPSTMQEAKRSRSKSVLAHLTRTQSATRGTKEGSVAPSQLRQLEKSKKSVEIEFARWSRGGEADRRHYPKLVKHLNSGKRSLGTSTIGR